MQINHILQECSQPLLKISHVTKIDNSNKFQMAAAATFCLSLVTRLLLKVFA